MGHALHRRGAGADDGHPLVGQPLHRCAVGITTGVVVVPTAGVERVPFEVGDAGESGELGHVQWPEAHANELGGEVIAPAAAHDPTGPLGVPLQTGDLGVKQGVVVETELLPDALAVLEDLGRMRILLGWHVTCLFQ